ncbi:MAG TPA: hypothetical protein VGN88_04170 [Phycisphaerae bacterium]|jgi:hypothetical protein
MTQHTLEYAALPPRDWSPLVLSAISCSLAFIEWPAVIFVGGLHDTLRGNSRFLPQDILATIIICGIPLLGIFSSFLFGWRARRYPLALFIALGAVVFHAWNLYAWGRMEMWFWTPL